MGSVLLYGASGHAKVICSLLESNNIKIFSIFDDNSNDSFLNEIRVVGKYNEEYKKNLKIIISIGDNLTRKKLSQLVSHDFTSVIHKSSIIESHSMIGVGTVVMQNVTIQSNTKIGKHCIINTHSVIEHDCIINDFVHVSPSATLCGNVFIDEGSHVGAGATIIPNIKIGKWCIVGAGAVVTKDVPDYSLVVGVPGKIIKTSYNE